MSGGTEARIDRTGPRMSLSHRPGDDPGRPQVAGVDRDCAVAVAVAAAAGGTQRIGASNSLQQPPPPDNGFGGACLVLAVARTRRHMMWL